MVFTVGNNIRISEPSKEILDWCRKELVIPNPDYEKKQRMGFWVGNTPRTLSIYQKDGKDIIVPFGVLKQLPLRKGNYVTTFAEPTSVDFKCNVPLYDYQEIAVQKMIEGQFGILQSKAGSGKTQMGIALASRLGVRTLWLCHTIDLLNQSKSRAELYMDKSLTGTITAGKIDIGTGITFATIQTMDSIDLEQYKDTWDCIIVDEVHRVAGTPTTMTRYEHVLNALRARHKYGLSATVHRADGMIKATFALVGEVVYTVPDSAVEDKIMRVGIVQRPTGINLDRTALNTDGTLNYVKMINYLAQCKDRNIMIANDIIKNADHSCLVLSDRIEHLTLLRDLVHDKVNCTLISGKMTTKAGKKQREQAIEDMRTGKVHVLFATYALAKEGLDIPRLDRLFLTTPQKDYAVVAQSIGRVARTFDGKEEAIAIDYTDHFIYAMKAYNKRCTTYRKEKCYFVEGTNEYIYV